MIKSVNLKGVSHDDFFQIMNLALAFLKKENLEELKLSEIAAAFEKAFNVYDEAFKQARKTGLVDTKKAIDMVRDNLVIGFYRTVRALLRFPDEELQQTAQRILDVLDKYGGTAIAEMPQGAESTAITNALQEITEADLETIGAKRWAERLGQENDRFIAIHKQQTAKQAEYVTGLLADERKNLDDEFRRLCKSIDSLAFVFGETPYQILANNINQLVANAQQTEKQKATARETAKKKSQEEETK
ncbi:MAG: DUF6261 family protein [Bacteroidia bacterium]|nr:DUF6261 family protein [Bacteroidia bacterium]